MRAMAGNPIASFSARRRWGIVLNVIFSAAALLALVVMANYLGAGYFKRFDWTHSSRFKLSAQTTKLLQSITNQVNVILFFDAKGEEEVYGWTSALLKQYHYVNPRVVVRTVDYTRFPGSAELVLAKYKLTALKEKNFVVFDCEGRSKIVNANQLADYNIREVLGGQSKEFKRTAFKGEMLCTSAIFAVTWPRPQSAYFVSGHGEHPPDDAGTIADFGYSKFAAILKDENNVAWQKLSLLSTNPIPADCSLLIIAGPATGKFDDFEFEKIEAYLKQGGRLLVLLNNLIRGGSSGLEKFLGKWNVGVASNMIFEEKDFSPGTGTDLYIAELDPQHPVSKPLAMEDLHVRLVLPRAVGQLQGAVATAGGPNVQVLARTSPKAVAKYQVTNTEVRFQTNTFPLMVAVEQGGIKGVTGDRGATRIVVVGDSLCLDNQVIDWAANHYFAGFAINWLLERPQALLAGLGPRPVTEYKVDLTGRQMRALRWIFLAAMPGLVLVVGGLVWLRRRS